MKLIFIYFLLVLILSCNTPNKPIDTTATFKRANEFYQNNDYSNAITAFDSLIANDSLNGEYYFKRGYSLSMLLYDVAAIEDYKKAIKCNYSKKEKTYLNIGIIYEGVINNYDSATYYLKQCLRVNPNNIKAKEKLNSIDTIRILMNKAKWHPK